MASEASEVELWQGQECFVATRQGFVWLALAHTIGVLKGTCQPSLEQAATACAENVAGAPRPLPVEHVYCNLGEGDTAFQVSSAWFGLGWS